jgi:hypothetical protein
MLQTKFAAEIKKHNLFTITFVFENSAINLIIWKNIIELGRPHLTIWRMRIACWVPKTTDIHSEYVILTAFLLQ